MKDIVVRIIIFFIDLVAIVLCLYWYDFKLVIILFIFFFANNLSKEFNERP